MSGCPRRPSCAVVDPYTANQRFFSWESAMSSTTAATAATVVFAVEGMSCGHCERTVSAALAALPGVTDVLADAKAGRVTVTATGDVDESQVRSAVDGAGFTLTGRL